MNPQTRRTTGHVAGFSDPCWTAKAARARHRADKLIGDVHPEVNVDAMNFDEMDAFIAQHDDGVPRVRQARFYPIRKFNLMFKTAIGVTEDSSSTCYLRPGNRAQGIFVNFANVQRTTRRKLPFGVCQVGKAFRNEITPGNFTFRTREFEQMECEFSASPEQTLSGLPIGRLLQKLAAQPWHSGKEPCACATTSPQSWRFIPTPPQTLNMLSRSPIGANCGDCRPHQLRPWPPSEASGKKPGIL